MALNPLLVIEDALIASMSANPVFLKELPFLAGIGRANAAAGTKKCGRCGSKASPQNTAYVAARRAIAQLPADKKIKLKQLLNAERVRIRYRDDRNQMIERTF